LHYYRGLWADYDNVTLEEARARIKNAGLPEPSIYVNSGHGIHAYWLLEERAGSEAIPLLKAIVGLLEQILYPHTWRVLCGYPAV